MNSQQFVIWLKGFAAAAGEFTLTPKQWDDLKEQLNNVDDTPYVSDNFTIGPNGAYERDPNQFPFGTPNGTTITTTPGYGSITIANPNITSFGTVTTSTATSLPSGSTISYTTSNDKTLLND